MSLTPEPARVSELAVAFRLLFDSIAPEDCETRVANALRLVQTGELDPQSLFVLRRPEGLLGAVLCLAVPGASGLVWPPRSVEDALQEQREDALLRHAARWLRGRGAKLAQALLAPSEVLLGAALERNGFAHVTHLWYMRHDLDLPAAVRSAPARLRFQNYGDCDRDLFHQTLLRTYEATQDCPEVSGVRTIDEVIAGHRAQGTFDPERWQLATLDGRPVGVTLLTELPESGDWDLSYMGVVPEARQRGLGRELLRKALLDADAADVECLTLSVDGRNRPAWNLYRGLGFEPFDRREIYLAIWRDAAP